MWCYFQFKAFCDSYIITKDIIISSNIIIINIINTIFIITITRSTIIYVKDLQNMWPRSWSFTCLECDNDSSWNHSLNVQVLKFIGGG